MNWFFKIKLTSGWLPGTLTIVTLVCLVALILLKSRKGWLRPLLSQLAVGACAWLVGTVAAWLVSDVFVVFGVSLGWTVIGTVGVGIGVAGALIAAIVQSHGLRRVLASLTLVLVVLTCALDVDGIYGEYTTMASVFGVTQFSKLEESETGPAKTTVAKWKKLAKTGKLPDMPASGEVHSVRIPATQSGFKARTANVYLPPAALSDKPPALPVMIVMAGQPGTPDRYFTAGVLGKMLNAYARSHDGLAPIAVSPDQNGSMTQNSLCADTPVYGKAETYLNVDVNHWIKSNLPVASAPSQWLIGGFSQGGTCSTQLGAARPDLYGHIFSVGGEIEPVDGSHNATLKRFFGSDKAKYASHVPINIIRRHAPSHQTWFSAAGERDKQSQKNQMAITSAAIDSGMDVTTVVVKGTGHDWHAVQAAMAPQIDLFAYECGLGGKPKSIASYPKLQVVESRSTKGD